MHLEFKRSTGMWFDLSGIDLLNSRCNDTKIPFCCEQNGTYIHSAPFCYNRGQTHKTNQVLCTPDTTVRHPDGIILRAFQNGYPQGTALQNYCRTQDRLATLLPIASSRVGQIGKIPKTPQTQPIFVWNFPHRCSFPHLATYNAMQSGINQITNEFVYLGHYMKKQNKILGTI